MSRYTLYMHVNKINGKKYIGITGGDPEKRWSGGHGYFRNKHFNDAIKRYGWDNFDHYILAEGLPKEEACRREKLLIKSFNTQDKRYGYNITDGGEHFKHSEESKRLMSERRKGINTGPFTEEHIRKIKEHHGGGAEKSPVVCIDTGIIYESINDASRATGINKKGISGCCRHITHYNTAGGYRWRFVSEV